MGSPKLGSESRPSHLHLELGSSSSNYRLIRPDTRRSHPSLSPAAALPFPAGPAFALLLPRGGALRADEHGFGQVPHDQLDRADAVVVAGNRQIDQIRIAVGIDQATTW